MNREIKYKAYIPKLKIIIDGVDVYANGTIGMLYDKLPKEFYIDWYDSAIVSKETDIYVMNILTGNNYIWFEDSQFELIQYTCLQDKNGTEIYEGDIVKATNGKNYEVKMYHGAWIGVNGDNGLPNYDFSVTEIIGNIFENPELLTP